MGVPADGRRAIAPIGALHPEAVDLTGPMPYPAIFDLTRGPTVSAHHYGRTTFLRDFPDELIDTVLEHVTHGTSPLSFAQIRPLGGAFARVPAEATAFAHRDKAFQLALINTWDGPGAQDNGPTAPGSTPSGPGWRPIRVRSLCQLPGAR